MKYKTLTTSEASQLNDTVASMLGFLVRLQDRMNGSGFDPTSSLYAFVVNARDSIHQLSVELHYQSCRHGVNRADRE